MKQDYEEPINWTFWITTLLAIALFLAVWYSWGWWRWPGRG